MTGGRMVRADPEALHSLAAALTRFTEDLGAAADGLAAATGEAAQDIATMPEVVDVLDQLGAAVRRPATDLAPVGERLGRLATTLDEYLGHNGGGPSGGQAAAHGAAGGAPGPAPVSNVRSPDDDSDPLEAPMKLELPHVMYTSALQSGASGALANAASWIATESKPSRTSAGSGGKNRASVRRDEAARDRAAAERHEKRRTAHKRDKRAGQRAIAQYERRSAPYEAYAQAFHVIADILDTAQEAIKMFAADILTTVPDWQTNAAGAIAIGAAALLQWLGPIAGTATAPDAKSEAKHVVRLVRADTDLLRSAHGAPRRTASAGTRGTAGSTTNRGSTHEAG